MLQKQNAGVLFVSNHLVLGGKVRNMKLLITPAIRLTDAQRAALEKEHTLYEIADERIPLSDQALDFSPDEVEGIICNFFFLHNPLSSLPSLRYIQLTSAGLDRVPAGEIREKGITLHNAGDIYALPMAEWTMCRILELYKHTDWFYERQKAHVWEKCRQVQELGGKTAAIIGYGNFGRTLAKRLRAFDTQIIAVDVRILDPAKEEYVDRYYPFTRVYEAVAEADVVILALPLLPETVHFAGDAFFAAMKDGSILVNAARGALIDEESLIRNLREGKIRGAALDVFEKEPLPEDHPLWKAEHVLLSPHNAFVGEGNAERLYRLVMKNLSNC